MSKTTILLIDDDDSLRRVTEFTLQEAGHSVLCAASGEEGLQRFAAEEPSIVITDIQMPGLSGYDVLRQVKAQKSETIVIVITAFATVEKAVEAAEVATILQGFAQALILGLESGDRNRPLDAEAMDEFLSRKNYCTFIAATTINQNVA